MLEPCYDSYVPAIELSGGTPVFVPLQFPDYSIDWDAVGRAVTPRTRMIMLNSPHNPAGSVLTPEDIEALVNLVDGTRILILSDEVYEHIIFDGLRHESCARHDALAARSFVVGSFGKTYHTTGWKVGYTVAPAALTAEFRKVHQFVTFSTNTPVQHAIADFLETRRGLAELGPFFQAKRDLFLRLMEGSRLPAARLPRQLLPAHGLLGDHRRGRRGLRHPADEGARGRVDSHVALPARRDRAEGPAILLREARRDARARRRPPVRGQAVNRESAQRLPDSRFTA